MKKASLLVSLLLVACQASPPATQPAPPVSALAPRAESLGPNLPIPEAERLKSATARITQTGGKESLVLKVLIKRPPMRIQAFDLNRIKWIRGLVKATDLQRHYENNDGDNGFVRVVADEGRLRIEGVPKGRNRVVQVQAYDEDANGQPVLLEGVVLKAIYSSPRMDQNDEIEVSFTLQSTLAASVLEELMERNPSLAQTIDANQLSSLLNGITTGPDRPANPPDVTPVAPGRINPDALADLIVTNFQANSQMPLPLTPADTVPPNWLYPSTQIQVSASNPAGTSYTNSKIVVQITDPVTQPQTILSGQGNLSLSFADVPPGNWEVLASLTDAGGVIRSQERLQLTVPADGGDPVFRNADGQVVTGPSLTLPPLLSELRTEQGQTQTAFAGGSTVVINGDGYDVANSQNNVVTINGRQIPLDPNFPVTATSLAIVLPADLGGQDLPVLVTTNGKASNQLSLDIEPVVVALNRNLLNGALVAADPGRSLVISVAGFDPSQYPDLKLQFVDALGNPLPGLVTPTALGTSSITVSVPFEAGTGSIQVLRNAELAALASPVLTVVSNPPDITSSNHQAGPGATFTISGAHFVPGNNSDTSPRSTVKLGDTLLPTTAYRVLDDGSIEITVPLTGYTPGTSYPVEVCTNAEGSALGCDSSTVLMLPPPDITAATWPSASLPIVLTGTNFVPDQTQVTINGQAIPVTDLTVTETSITISNPPATAGGGSLVVTTPHGSDTTVLPLYADLVNFIGSQTWYRDDVTGLFTQTNPTVSTAVNDPHGITVEGCSNIYVVGNGTQLLYKFNLAGTLQWVKTLEVISEDVATGPDGMVYVAATSGNRIDKYDPATGDYLGAVATSGESFLGPEGIETSADGQYLYVSSNTTPNSSTYSASNSVKVVKIHIGSAETTKPVTLVAGGAQRPTPATGPEPIATALFHHLEGLGADAQNNIYVAEADREFRQIRKINQSAGTVTVHASFPLNFAIHEIRVEPDGSVIVPGENSHRIYRISPEGEITTVAGTGAFGVRQGPVATGSFATPVGVDFDLDGNLYIADRSWGIRKINRFSPRSGTKLCP